MKDIPLLAGFVKEKRAKRKLTQPELATKAGVGLHFIRDLEQGKPTLRLDKVNQVLALFGHEAGAVPLTNSKNDDQDGSSMDES
jgi:y4mF family transcriptional regulator